MRSPLCIRLQNNGIPILQSIGCDISCNVSNNNNVCNKNVDINANFGNILYSEVNGWNVTNNNNNVAVPYGNSNCHATTNTSTLQPNAVHHNMTII